MGTLDAERAIEPKVDAQGMLQELAVLFHYLDPDKKRVEGLVIPTNESLEILEDYLSRWSWIIVQKLSEPGVVTPEFAPEDAELSLQDAVIEMVLYGVAYLAARRNRPVDEVIPGEEGAVDQIVKDNQYVPNESPLKGEDVQLNLCSRDETVEEDKTEEQCNDAE